MLRFVLQRLAFIALALFVVTLVTYFLMEAAPGSYYNIHNLQANLNSGGIAQAQLLQQKAWDSQWGFGKPWYDQYWLYVRNIFDWSHSTTFEYPGTPLSVIVGQSAPYSVGMALAAVTVALMVAVPLGTVAALRHNTYVDRGSMFAAMIGTSLPVYVLAIFLILVFSLWLRWLPVFGYNHWYNFIMPVLALSLPMIGALSRYMRNSLAENLTRDYVTAVIAKGGGPVQIVWVHALRNSLIPLVTVLGPLLGATIMGTLFVESMFDIPGLGHYFAGAASSRDYPMIEISTFLYAALIMIMNFLVDIAYGLLDPRIRRSGSTTG